MLSAAGDRGTGWPNGWRCSTSGYRDAEARHQSLRACVEWSYDLCTQVEQRFWARSSVFTGGYDLEAAAAVCGADDLPAEEVLDLVSETRRPVGRPRRGEPPRATRATACSPTSGSSGSSGPRRTASSRASSSGTPAGTPSWSPASTDDACGPHQIDWLRRLRLEQANLRTAIAHYARALDEAAAAVAMARQLDLYWSASGLLDEARHWLEIGLASGAGTPQERSLAMAVAARFAVLQHDRLRARELIEEGDGGGDVRGRPPRARVAAGAGRDALRLGGHPGGGCGSGRQGGGAPAGCSPTCPVS